MNDRNTTTSERQLRAIVIDDHPLLQLGLSSLLEQNGIAASRGTVTCPEEMVAEAAALAPDCAVLDLGLPIEGGGLGLIRPLSGLRIKVVVLTGESGAARWGRCLHEGAEVVLSKSESLDDIVEVVRLVGLGQKVRLHQRTALTHEAQVAAAEQHRLLAPFQDLSRREQEVLAALMDGLSPTEIAQRDFVSVQTIRTQVKTLLRKLSARSQLEAVAKAQAAGWKPRLPALQV